MKERLELKTHKWAVILTTAWPMVIGLVIVMLMTLPFMPFAMSLQIGGILVAIILHRGKVIVPFGDSVIQAGDNVVVVSSESGISDLNEVIRR